MDSFGEKVNTAYLDHERGELVNGKPLSNLVVLVKSVGHIEVGMNIGVCHEFMFI